MCRLFADDDPKAAIANTDIATLITMEAIEACCKDDLDLAIVRLGAMGYTPTEIARRMKVPRPKIKARREELSKRFDGHGCDESPAPKVERARTVRPLKPNGAELALGA
jgi:hypothetical protein